MLSQPKAESGVERNIALCSEGHFSEYDKQKRLPVEIVLEMKDK